MRREIKVPKGNAINDVGDVEVAPLKEPRTMRGWVSLRGLLGLGGQASRGKNNA